MEYSQESFLPVIPQNHTGQPARKLPFTVRIRFVIRKRTVYIQMRMNLLLEYFSGEPI